MSEAHFVRVIWRLSVVVLGLVSAGCGGTSSPPSSPEGAVPRPSTPPGPSSDEVEALNRCPLRPEDQLALAKHLEAGDIILKDPERALYWTFRAARGGNAEAVERLRRRAQGEGKSDPVAQLYLAMVIGLGPDSEASSAEVDALLDSALQALRPAAERGDALAQYALGMAHDGGWGMPKDEAAAVVLYEKAARQGLAAAQFQLGLAFSEGRGVTANLGEAVAWYRKGAEQGEPMSQNNLGRSLFEGRGVEQDKAQALLWYRRSAALGNAVAQNNLGMSYYHGDGTAQDHATAFRWFHRAAEQGYSTAQANLAAMYYGGAGVDQDRRNAFDWYRRAAENGDARALLVMGDYHAEGDGVDVDLDAAADWYRQALDAGNDAAKAKLERLLAAKNCREDAGTALFSVALKCAFRGQLRQAVKRAGGVAKREEDRFWFDVYRSDALLDGSSELQLGYTLDGRFARATYVFPSHVDRFQVKRIAELVASKYGPPRDVQGSLELGEVSYLWTQADGVRVRVHRGWPATTTYLEFEHPETVTILEAEIGANRDRERQEDMQRQSEAF